jgi:hypothetical protein
MARSTEKLNSTTTKSRIGRLVAPLALALGVITPSVAHAWLPYQSGAACIPKNSTEAGKLEYDSVNGMQNKSTSSATLYCPFVYGGDQASTYAEVWVTDQNPNANANFTVKGRNRDGSVLWNSGPLYTSGSSSAAQMLHFQSLPVWEYKIEFTAMCSLPPIYGSSTSRINNLGIDFQD